MPGWLERCTALAARANPFKPVTADQARLGIQCAVAIAIGCLFCVINPLWTGLLRTGVWVIVSVLVVLEPNVGSTLRKSWLRVVGTALGGFGSIAMLEIAYAAGGGKDWENNSVPMAVTITVLQSVVGALMLLWKVQHPARSYAYLVTSFTLPIVWVPGLRSPEGQEVVDAIRRLVSIIIGIAIACAVQVLVFPVFARRQLTERLAAALEENMDMLLAAVDSALYQPRGSAGGVGGASKTTGSPGAQTAILQRAQRKVASGLDKLLEPTATELWFVHGPLSAAAYASLVDAVAVVGSTAVTLTAVLEAAHTNVAGTDRHPLPPELEERLDATTTALVAAFAVLAARIHDTLEGCCLSRHRWENNLFYSATVCCGRPLRRQSGPATNPGGPAAVPPKGRSPGAASEAVDEEAQLDALTPGLALEAAAAQFQQLAQGHEAARGALAPSESDLCVVALGACLVLIQQARAVAEVLQAATPSAAEQAETVRRSGAGGKQRQGGKV